MHFRKLLTICFGLSFVTATFLATGCAPLSGKTSVSGPGTLSIVSLGTGDPDNVTIRAQKAIAAADVVFTMGGRSDRYGELLKGKEVHDAGHRLFVKASGEAKRLSSHPVAAGSNEPKRRSSGDDRRMRKSPEQIAAQQEETRRIIRDAVAAGRHVAILDNGDPTIFGPHIGYIREFADLNPVIVPGLSSFNAANAALQTSVVDGSSRTVALSLGRLDNGRDEILTRMISEGTTLAFFMVRDLDAFISGLNARLPGDTPAAIVADAGAGSRQRVIRGTLDTILAKTAGEKLPAYLLYVGDCLR
jgi:precorrin-4/cobalt-precorrin-4 C11-methyltransferase